MQLAGRDVIELSARAELTAQRGAFVTDDQMQIALQQLQWMQARERGHELVALEPHNTETEKAQQEEAVSILHAVCAELEAQLSHITSQPSENMDSSAIANLQTALSTAQAQLMSAMSPGANAAATLASARAFSASVIQTARDTDSAVSRESRFEFAEMNIEAIQSFDYQNILDLEYEHFAAMTPEQFAAFDARFQKVVGEEAQTSLGLAEERAKQLEAAGDAEKAERIRQQAEAIARNLAVAEAAGDSRGVAVANIGAATISGDEDRRTKAIDAFAQREYAHAIANGATEEQAQDIASEAKQTGQNVAEIWAKELENGATREEIDADIEKELESFAPYTKNIATGSLSTPANHESSAPVHTDKEETPKPLSLNSFSFASFEPTAQNVQINPIQSIAAEQTKESAASLEEGANTDQKTEVEIKLTHVEEISPPLPTSQVSNTKSNTIV